MYKNKPSLLFCCLEIHSYMPVLFVKLLNILPKAIEMEIIFLVMSLEVNIVIHIFFKSFHTFSCLKIVQYVEAHSTFSHLYGGVF